jgi:hypothetical protein
MLKKFSMFEYPYPNLTVTLILLLTASIPAFESRFFPAAIILSKCLSGFSESSLNARILQRFARLIHACNLFVNYFHILTEFSAILSTCMHDKAQGCSQQDYLSSLIELQVNHLDSLTASILTLL